MIKLIISIFGLILVIIGLGITISGKRKTLSVGKKVKNGTAFWVQVKSCSGMDDWYHITGKKIYPNKGTVEIYTEKEHEPESYIMIEEKDNEFYVLEKENKSVFFPVMLLLIGTVLLYFTI